MSHLAVVCFSHIRFTKVSCCALGLILGAVLVFWSVKNANGAIIIGNPKGYVTLSLIYDYQCVSCHRMFRVVQQLISENSDLKVKLYPVAAVNRNSLFEAAAAIAVTRMPGKFQEFTSLLMYQKPLQQSKILKFMHKLKLDSKNFLTVMHSSWVRSQLLEGVEMMQQMHSSRVPIVLISKSGVGLEESKVFVGEQSYKTLVGVINDAYRA